MLHYFRENDIALVMEEDDEEDLIADSIDFVPFSYYGSGTLERKHKKSFFWYKDVIASRGETLKV